MSAYIDVPDKESLLNILVTGCDERVFLREKSNANKYHLNPLGYADLLQRGSCTCNLLTPDGHEVAKEFMATYKEKAYFDIVKNQMGRIKQNFQDSGNPATSFEVIFGPSGSDMMYVPILFKSILLPGTKVVNLVTCPDELGSGSVPAAELRYYAEFNQFGENIKNGGPLDVSATPDLSVETSYLPAREGECGVIIDRREKLRATIDQHLNANTTNNKFTPLVVNLVYGSKSGIKDDLAIIEEYAEAAMQQKIMFVVDMCQFRFLETGLLHQLLSRNVMVMITGSKFFQAPPFCGALLVPNPIIKSLLGAKQVQGEAAIAAKTSAMAHIFSMYDFPEALQPFAKHLRPFENKGLRVRWEIGLQEMEAYFGYPEHRRTNAINRWKAVIMGRLAQTDVFEIMPNPNDTVESIVSFRVFPHGDKTKPSLNKKELQACFDKLVLGKVTGLAPPYQKVFIGQPVAFGNKAFIRLAIGSYGIREILQREDSGQKYCADNDLRLIQIIQDLVNEMYISGGR